MYLQLLQTAKVTSDNKNQHGFAVIAECIFSTSFSPVLKNIKTGKHAESTISQNDLLILSKKTKMCLFGNTI